MTTEQAIALGFPVFTGVAVAATGLLVSWYYGRPRVKSDSLAAHAETAVFLGAEEAHAMGQNLQEALDHMTTSVSEVERRIEQAVRERREPQRPRQRPPRTRAPQ